MKKYEEHAAAKREAYVLMVDDIATTRAMHSLMLSRHFEVKGAASGKEALELCSERLPELILLDVEMPGMDGFETCRRLRERFDVPIIFVTSHDSLDEHLKAYEAGGNDLCLKPVSAELLIRKARLAIRQWRERNALRAEREALQAQVEQFQSGMSESRLLLQFARVSLGCERYEQLAQNFLRVCQRLSMQCCIAIRHDETEAAWSEDGEASAIERAVLAQIARMGNLVQFKNRLAINSGRLSVVVSNMPEEGSEEAARIRNTMSLFVDMAAALADNIEQRRAQPVEETAAADPGSVEAFYQRQRLMVAEVRLLLQEVLDNLDMAFDKIVADKHQEDCINQAVRVPIDKIQAVLERAMTAPLP